MKQIQIYQIETNTDLSEDLIKDPTSIDLTDLIHESDRFKSCRSDRDLIDSDLIEI